MIKKMSFAFMALFVTLSASAQLKVSSTGKVSVGTTSASSSALSVNSTGHSRYATFIKGNCKVDSGYVTGDLFTPAEIYGYYQSSISPSTLARLLQLIPVKLTPFNPLFQSPDNAEIDDEDSTRVLGVNERFAITGASMTDNFNDLVKRNENGQYIVNYVELIPLLLAGYQEIIDELQHLLSLVNNASTTNESNDEEMLESPRTTQLMAAQQFNKAKLYQNNPNPFTAQTEIRFRLPQDAKNAFVYIFDMTGKMLKQIPVTPNDQSVTVQGYEFSPGIYLYSLSVDGQEIDTKRMILSK